MVCGDTGMADITAHETRFRQYAESKIAAAENDAGPLRLKLKHTFQVLANARRIAAEENFSASIVRVCALSALYHDLARFDQYLQYGTFKDTQSRNHGLWAVTLVRQLGLLNEETPEIRRRTLTAIAVHNKLDVPPHLDGADTALANALRDADKLDILRVMDEHLSGPGPYNPTVVLSLPCDRHLYSEKTINCALMHKPAAYGDLRSVNDFRLLLGTWIFAMNFASSRRMFRQCGHAQRLLDPLPEAYAEARAEILGCLNTGGKGLDE